MQLPHVAISGTTRYARRRLTEDSPVIQSLIAAASVPTTVGLGVLLTGLFLGIRHGIDWDHIAAITDITSTTASARMAEAAHTQQHQAISGHSHGHGGAIEVRAHHAGPGAATLAPALPAPAGRRQEGSSRPGGRISLGTLYALGHGLVVIVLGSRALTFGALLPDWLDPLMGRVVG
jgi:high-affinity nickel-transport protein